MNKNKFDKQYDILIMSDPGVKLTPVEGKQVCSLLHVCHPHIENY